MSDEVAERRNPVAGLKSEMYALGTTAFEESKTVPVSVLVAVA